MMWPFLALQLLFVCVPTFRQVSQVLLFLCSGLTSLVFYKHLSVLFLYDLSDKSTSNVFYIVHVSLCIDHFNKRCTIHVQSVHV